MLIPFRFVLYQAEVAPGDVFVLLTGVAADPQVGEGTVLIEIVSVTPPVEGDNFVAPWDWWPKEVIVHLKGVAANPRVGSGTLQVPRRTGIPRQWQYPKRQVAPKPLEMPSRMTWTPASVQLVGVTSVSAVGTGTVKIVLQLNGPKPLPELSDDEIMAILQIAA